MIPNIEEDYILLLVIVFCTRNITLLGSTTKKHYSSGARFPPSTLGLRIQLEFKDEVVEFKLTRGKSLRVQVFNKLSTWDVGNGNCSADWKCPGG